MVRRDVESTQPLMPDNPYTRGPPSAAEQVFNKMYRAVIFFVSLYFLHTWEVYATVLRSPKVSHEWFKIGMAASIGLLSVKMYVEIFAGKIQKKKVNYENFRQSTHAAIWLLLLASVAFHVALWPAYQWKTVAIMIIIGYGVLLQASLLVPTYVQNAVGIIAMTFFIQEYA